MFNTNNILNSAQKVGSQLNNIFSKSNTGDLSTVKLMDWLGDLYETMDLWRDESGNGFYRGKKIAELISRFFGNYGT